MWQGPLRIAWVSIRREVGRPIGNNGRGARQLSGRAPLSETAGDTAAQTRPCTGLCGERDRCDANEIGVMLRDRCGATRSMWCYEIDVVRVRSVKGEDIGAMTWKLDRCLAVGECGVGEQPGLNIQIDAARPTPGIVQASWSGRLLPGFWQEVNGNLFDTPPSIEEMYVRGSDLVCRYREHPGSKLTPTVYWRMGSDPKSGFAWVETRLAVETSTLGTQPHVSIDWHLPHGHLTEFGLSELLIDRLSRQLDQPVSYLDRHQAEGFRIGHVSLDFPGGSHADATSTNVFVVPLVHLSDFQQQSFVVDGETIEIRQPLGLELLEKGVIRTARRPLSGERFAPERSGDHGGGGRVF